MKSRFMIGMGIGVLAGSAFAMLISPPGNKRKLKTGAGRAIKALGDVVETVSDALS